MSAVLTVIGAFPGSRDVVCCSLCADYTPPSCRLRVGHRMARVVARWPAAAWVTGSDPGKGSGGFVLGIETLEIGVHGRDARVFGQCRVEVFPRRFKVALHGSYDPAI